MLKLNNWDQNNLKFNGWVELYREDRILKSNSPDFDCTLQGCNDLEIGKYVIGINLGTNLSWFQGFNSTISGKLINPGIGKKP